MQWRRKRRWFETCSWNNSLKIENGRLKRNRNVKWEYHMCQWGEGLNQFPKLWCSDPSFSPCYSNWSEKRDSKWIAEIIDDREGWEWWAILDGHMEEEGGEIDVWTVGTNNVLRRATVNMWREIDSNSGRNSVRNSSKRHSWALAWKRLSNSVTH